MNWQGCQYVARAHYSFFVETTNGTLEQVRQKFPSATDLTVGGRHAIRYQADPSMPGSCIVNVEMKAGSLYISVDDPQHGAGQAPCDTANTVATAVVPLIPAGA